MKLKILQENRNNQCLLNNTRKQEQKNNTLKVLKSCQVMMYVKD